MNKESLQNLLVEEICELFPHIDRSTVVSDTSMEELGIGSMDRAEITINILEKIELEIPLSKIVGPKNIGELASHLLDLKSSNE